MTVLQEMERAWRFPALYSALAMKSPFTSERILTLYMRHQFVKQVRDLFGYIQSASAK